MVSLFNSEVHITPDGVETIAQKTNRSPMFMPISGDDYLRTTKLIDKRLEQLVDDYPSDDIYFIFKGRKCSLEVLRVILEDGELCEAISEELEFRTFKTIMEFQDSEAMVDPHQNVTYGDYQMEIVSDIGDCQSSLNLSLFSSDKESNQRREWCWYLYSEIDGVVDHLQRVMPVEEYSAQDVLIGLVEMAELLVTLPEFKAMLNE